MGSFPEVLNLNWLFLTLNQFICNYTIEAANWASSDAVLFHKLRRSINHFTHETESPWPVYFKHSHWWKRLTWSKFASHYAWGTNGVCKCKMDVKVYMVSYKTSNGSCFMVTWIIFKNHLLEVGLTRNRKTTALRTPTTVDLFTFITHEDMHE